MNYTGYGTDPNYIYSFRPSSGNAGMMRGFGLMGFDQAMNPLRSSLAYRQAGMEGKQRMEKVESMGLPFNTDINRVEKVGINPNGFGPIYRAPRPLPWGTWGAVGGGEERPVKLKEPIGIPSQREDGITQSPSLTEATQINESELGQSGSPLAFTGFGQMARNQKADQYQTPIGQGISSLPSTSPTLAAAGVPRFPYAGAESAFERTTRETNAFGSAPMFPSSRFGGPQPNERTGPIATQPRRSWMY